MYVEYYNGEHSVIFGNKHSWEDWHLIPQSKPIITVPALREKYIEIPGADGRIDLTECLTGHPSFDQRTGSLRFIVDTDQWSWEDAYTTIMNAIHGRQVKMVLTDDPDWYYEGRITVNTYETGKDISAITLNYSLSPFRFSTKEIMGYKDLSVTVTRTIVITMPDVPVYQTPAISSSAEITMALERQDGYEAEVDLEIGDKIEYYAISLGPGLNTLTFTGTGTVSVHARYPSL